MTPSSLALYQEFVRSVEYRKIFECWYSMELYTGGEVGMLIFIFLWALRGKKKRHKWCVELAGNSEMSKVGTHVP